MGSEGTWPRRFLSDQHVKEGGLELVNVLAVTAVNTALSIYPFLFSLPSLQF